MISGTLFGIGAVLAIFITSRILFPDAKIFVLIRGFFSSWVEDKAKTPEGAKAIYTEKIKELQNSYNKANDTLQRIVGQKTTVEKELKHFKEELTEVEKNCEALAKKQKWEAVEEIAEHREDLMAEIELRENLLKELIPQVEEEQFINNKLEVNLSNMKKEKDRIIRDKTSSPEDIKLTEQRAKTVANYLISQGIDASRFVIVGNGINNQIANNSTEEGRKQNRRTDIKFLLLE